MGTNRRGLKRLHFELRQVKSDGSEEIRLCSLREVVQSAEAVHMGRRGFLSVSALVGAMSLIASCTRTPAPTPTPTPELVKARSLCEKILAHRKSVSSVAFSPDGKLLASAGEDTTVKLWEVAPATLLRTLKGHTANVRSAAFSPGGKLLASGSWDKTIRVWDVASGALLNTLKGHTKAVVSVAFSPDSKLLASASADTTIRLWDATSAALLNTLEGHKGSVGSIAFSPDGKLLASGSADKTIKLWDATSAALLNTLEGHKGSVGSIAFGPDGKLLASGSADKTIKLWEIASKDKGPAAMPIQDSKQLPKPTLSPTTAPADTTIAARPITYTIKPGDTLSAIAKAHGVTIEALVEANDISDPDLVRVGQKLVILPPGKEATPLSGQRRMPTVTPTTSNLQPPRAVSAQVVLEIHGSLLKTLEGQTADVESIAFSPDGKLLASGSEDATIRLWDVASGALLNILKGHTADVESIAFSPDGKLLASGGGDKTVKLWDAVGFDGNLTTCLWDPATMGKDQEAFTYRLQGGTRTYTLPCGSPIPPGAICTCNCVPGTYVAPPSRPGRRICTCVPVCICMAV